MIVLTSSEYRLSFSAVFRDTIAPGYSFGSVPSLASRFLKLFITPSLPPPLRWTPFHTREAAARLAMAYEYNFNNVTALKSIA